MELSRKGPLKRVECFAIVPIVNTYLEEMASNIIENSFVRQSLKKTVKKNNKFTSKFI